MLDALIFTKQKTDLPNKIKPTAFFSCGLYGKSCLKIKLSVEVAKNNSMQPQRQTNLWEIKPAAC